MSILIKGMEMPSNCAECPLNHDAECAVKNCMVMDDCYVRRAFWCPLIPVQRHGRLIDADALLNRDADYEYPLFDTDGSWDCVVPCYDRETIKSAPTVIEAEEVEP